jgi:hypothetical protein
MELLEENVEEKHCIGFGNDFLGNYKKAHQIVLLQDEKLLYTKGHYQERKKKSI